MPLYNTRCLGLKSHNCVAQGPPPQLKESSYEKKYTRTFFRMMGNSSLNSLRILMLPSFNSAKMFIASCAVTKAVREFLRSSAKLESLLARPFHG